MTVRVHIWGLNSSADAHCVYFSLDDMVNYDQEPEDYVFAYGDEDDDHDGGRSVQLLDNDFGGHEVVGGDGRAHNLRAW